jgi:hypothetical protein
MTAKEKARRSGPSLRIVGGSVPDVVRGRGGHRAGDGGHGGKLVIREDAGGEVDAVARIKGGEAGGDRVAAHIGGVEIEGVLIGHNWKYTDAIPGVKR